MKRPLCFVCLLFGMLLLFLMWAVPLPVTDYSSLDGQMVTLEGEVYQKEYKEQQYNGGQPETILIVYLKKVHILNESDKTDSFHKTKQESEQFPQNELQNIMCYMEELRIEPAIGQTLRVSGKVRCFQEAGNPGEFDVRNYYSIMKLDFSLRKAQITAIGGKENFIRERLYLLRRHFSGVLEQVFEEKEASVMKAMLLGEKNGLDEGTKELYQQSSIIHILSISGLHISIIGMGLYRMLRRTGVPLKISAVAAILCIGGYGMMTGMSLSAVRAIFMFTMHLAADMWGRTYDMLTALSLAAVLLLIEQPGYVEHAGFLFSFGSVAAIGVFLPVLQGRQGKIRQALEAGLAVTLVTLPIHLLYYYQFPIYSILLNLAVIPLMTVVMGVGLFVMFAGDLLPFAASLVSYIDVGILWFYEKCCLICKEIPGGVFVSGRPENWQAGVYILLLTVLAVIHKKMPDFWKKQWIIAALCVLLFRAEGDLRITMLDVGQGDCIHIQSDSGRHYLIDGGSSTKSEVAEYQIIPYLKSRGVSRLEAVFVTHSDIDHCNGIISLLEKRKENRLDIGSLILPDVEEKYRDEQYHRMEELAVEQGIPVQYMSSGEFLEDEELRLTCVHPSKGYGADNANEYSLVLYLTYGKFTALFTGDVEGAGERTAWQKAVENKKELTLLKVAHHGSSYSTGEEMLSELSPAYALISCGKNNRYGHPHKELLKRLEDAGCRSYLTTESGAVTVKTDGERCVVECFK